MVKHRFSYPIFFCYVNVDKMPGLVPRSWIGGKEERNHWRSEAMGGA